MNIKILALDLERTLIDDAFGGQPRPGLLEFLTFCHKRFGRVALFTTIEEADAREVVDDLMRGGHLPPGLSNRLEYVDWCGEFKDLGFVDGADADEILLVDDDAGWVRPDQRERWIPIEPWDGGPDVELPRVQSLLESLIAVRPPNNV